MRKFTLITLLAGFSLAACKKEGSQPSVSESSNGYIINGISDFTVRQDSSATMVLAIAHEKGEQQQVTLSAENLPAGASVNFSSESGTPSFGSIVTISAGYSTPVGKHTFKIKGTGSKGTVKEYNVNMNVTQGPPCEKKLQAEYSVTNSCNNPNATNKCSIIMSNGELIMSRFPENISVSYTRTTFNCENQTITIPEQINTANPYKWIKGQATFGGNKIEVKLYSRFAAGTVWEDSCNYTLQKLY